MSDQRQNVFVIATFVLLVPAVIVLLGALDIFSVGEEMSEFDPLENPVGAMLNVKNWDWKALLMSGTGLVAIIGGAWILKLPAGATVFAITFTFMGGFTGALLHVFESAPYYMMPEISAIITLFITFAFLYAFIRLSST